MPTPEVTVRAHLRDIFAEICTDVSPDKIVLVRDGGDHIRFGIQGYNDAADAYRLTLKNILNTADGTRERIDMKLSSFEYLFEGDLQTLAALDWVGIKNRWHRAVQERLSGIDVFRG